MKADPQPLQRSFSIESSSLNTASQRHSRRSSSFEPEAGDELDDLEDYQEFGDFNDDISVSLREMIRKRGGIPSRKVASSKAISVVRKKIVNGEAEEARMPRLPGHKKVFDDECKQIESRLACLPSLDALVDQYCTLKYSSLEQALSSSSSRNSQLARELRKWEAALKIATVEFKISVCANSFYELVREIDEEFIKPRYSARQNINRLIQEALDVEKQYSYLQTIFRQYTQHTNLIVQDLDSLRKDSRVISSARRIVYRQLKESILKSTIELNRSAHIFRTCYLLRKRCDGPFAAAWNLRLLAVYGPVSNHDQARSETLRRSVEALISTGHSNKRRGSNAIAPKKPWTYNSLMFRFYLPRKGKQLDIFWRQLDVLAPFELNWLTTATLSLELEFLITSLRVHSPGSWSKLDTQSRWQHYTALKESLRLFDDLRAQISYHYGSLRTINWLRLQSENRLHALGVRDSTRQRGLFTPPNPLSQSISTFTKWTHSMASNVSMSKHLRVKIEELAFASRTQTEHNNTNSQATPEDLQNFEARQTHSAVLDPLHFQTEYSLEPLQDALSIPNASLQREELPHAPQRLVEWRSKNELTFSNQTGMLQNPLTTKSAKDVTLSASQGVSLNVRGEHSDSQGLSVLKSDVVSATTRKPEKSSKRFSKNPGSQRQENLKPFNTDAKKRSKRFAKGEKPDQAHSDSKPQIKGIMGSQTDECHNQATTDDSNWMENSIMFPTTHDTKLRPKKTASFNDHYSKPSFTKRSIAGCFTSAKSALFSSRYKPLSVRRYRSPRIALAEKEANERSENVLPPISRSLSGSNPGPSCLQQFHLDTGGSPSLDDLKSISSMVEPISNRHESLTEPRFWSHNLYKGSGGGNILVHYCRSLESTERVANCFLDSDVVGFDIEWKIQPLSTSDIQSNVSLIQIANEERIALFQIAAFKPGKTLDHLVSPSLKKLLESPNVTKAGVSIKADCTRLRKYLDIDTRGLFELSHLYKLVKHCQSDPKLINKRVVNLSLQVEEHLGLPMDKHVDVRCSDWTRFLGYRQVQCKIANFVFRRHLANVL